MIPAVPPALVLGGMLCLGYAALLHLWLGRNLRDLIITLVMAAIGFGFGQVIGTLTNLSMLQIGQLHVVEASIGAWLLMTIARLIAP